MSGWLALSDRDGALGGHPEDGMLERGTLVVELALPLGPASVLLDCQRDGPAAFTFSIFHDPSGGIGILHRQGASVARHMLPAPLPGAGSTARLTLTWAVDSDPRKGAGSPTAGNAGAVSETLGWSLTFEVAGQDPVCRTGSEVPLALPVAELLAMCRGQGLRFRHPSVLWFGVTLGAALPRTSAWIGLRTPVDTVRGPVPAGALRAGDLVMTRDDGPVALQGTRRLDLPGRGSYAPVLLRAPYFGQQADILVSSDQPVVLSGAGVEYLFGEDEVLVRAAALVDGRSALADNRRAVVSCVSLDLGAPALITAQGCMLATEFHGPAHLAPPLPRRLLHTFETLPLAAQFGREIWRSVA